MKKSETNSPTNPEVETTRQQESLFARRLIEASLDPLVTISPEGKITDMNLATVNITGLTREQLRGTDFFSYFTQPLKARDVYQEVFAKGSITDSALTLSHKDGKLTNVLLNGSVYKDSKNHVLGVVIVARDVTEQKRIETELIEAKVFAELATELAMTAKQKAESSSKVANDAVKAKQQFLSNMSHEIRTPMNAIIGFTKVLLKTDMSAKQKEYLTAIKLSGDALIVLINDILDLAKVDAGKMVFEHIPFRMSMSISAMLHLFEPKIHEKNLRLTKEYDSRIPEVLLGDSVRLHQIIMNLVSNAVKFTEKGKISLSVRLIDEDDEKVIVEFAISDTGVGIPTEKLEKIFENFQQASSNTSRIYGGTGLGLAIVKQLVEHQGGTVKVKSVVGKGSTFSFVLSFAKTTESVESEAEIMEFDKVLHEVKVLVVEDIVLNQLLMKTVLDDFGFETDIASNGKLALEKLRANSYDIILMDLQMPEINGFEATEYIRKTMKSNIPIIALTADVTTVDLKKCKAVGMDDYIAKPVDERLLYTKMVSSLKKNEHKRVHLPEKKDKEPNTSTINLDYLNRRTKSNPDLMIQMITLYLNQTPVLIKSINKSLKDKNWKSVYTAVHKLIPSFTIMGIGREYETIAKNVQEYASTGQQTDRIPELVLQLVSVLEQSCEELEIELELIKNTRI